MIYILNETSAIRMTSMETIFGVLLATPRSRESTNTSVIQFALH